MPTRPSILVVDDEVDICQNLADILSDQDYVVDVATSGADALELARRKSYDVALLDLKMPGMDGVTLYRRLREMRPELVAIVVTAYATDPTINKAVQCGAWRVIPKPVDLIQLLTLVKNAVKQPLVLVVDDDKELCESLWDLFREWNLRVCVVHSEQDAMLRLKDQEYQIVLVDLKLPEGDGRNLIGVLHSERPHVRTILITAYSECLGDNALGGKQAAPDAVCMKPFQLGTLRETIARLTRVPTDGE